MSRSCCNSHYKGQDPLGHLLEARSKGYSAGAEPHGLELSGKARAFWDSARSSIVFIAIFSFLTLSIPTLFSISIPALQNASALLTLLVPGSISFTLWLTGRSFFIAKSRLEKMQRVMLEEKREIEENRDEEKSELKDIYALKGFEGKLLDEVVEVLASDKNRLLQIMLEEELGVARFSQEHPIKQSFFAGLGAFIFGIATAFCFAYLPLMPATFTMLGLFVLSASAIAKIERAPFIGSVVWQLAIAVATLGFLHFFIKAL